MQGQDNVSRARGRRSWDFGKEFLDFSASRFLRRILSRFPRVFGRSWERLGPPVPDPGSGSAALLWDALPVPWEYFPSAALDSFLLLAFFGFGWSKPALPRVLRTFLLALRRVLTPRTRLIWVDNDGRYFGTSRDKGKASLPIQSLRSQSSPFPSSPRSPIPRNSSSSSFPKVVFKIPALITPQMSPAGISPN